MTIDGGDSISVQLYEHLYIFVDEETRSLMLLLEGDVRPSPHPGIHLSEATTVKLITSLQRHLANLRTLPLSDT